MAAPREIPQKTTGPFVRASAKALAAWASAFSNQPKLETSPPLAPWCRRSKSSALQPWACTNGTFFTISRRERLRPWMSTTVPFASGAGTHHPLRATPSAAGKETSSKGRSKEAGVRPLLALSLYWNRRLVAIPPSQ